MSKIASKASNSKNSKVTTLKSVLLQIQLQQYLPLFQRSEIDFSTFLTLNEQSLKSVGIRNDSHRKLLLIYIRKLQRLLASTAAVIPTENNMPSEPTDEDGSAKVSIDEAVLTPITEEEEVEIPNDETEVTQNNEEINENMKSQVRDPIQNEIPTNETQPNSIPPGDENNCAPARSRKHYSADNEDLLAMRRQRGTAVRDKNWRLSTPVTTSELPPCYNEVQLPSYYDIVDQQCIKTREVVFDELPSYSCSVQKSGYIFKKNEFSLKGYRARDRSWKKQYLYLWGTFLRLYKSEPIDINRVNPTHEFSLQSAQISLATDYTKRKYVIRVRISTGHQFLLQVQDYNECVSWIENLQSSVNISLPLDEREMPMFITLPMRRRRAGVVASTATPSTSTSFSSINGESITIINSSSMPVSASGLTFQQFNDMARELQQVQITEALPQQQLLW